MVDTNVSENLASSIFTVKMIVTMCGVAVGYQSFGGYFCLHHRENGGSKVLRNFGILPQQYIASQLRKPRLERVLDL
jgi:hypothetical protein